MLLDGESEVGLLRLAHTLLLANRRRPRKPERNTAKSTDRRRSAGGEGA
jgi:hypothetical protein